MTQFADKIGYSRNRIVRIINYTEASEHITVSLEQRIRAVFDFEGNTYLALIVSGLRRRHRRPEFD